VDAGFLAFETEPPFWVDRRWRVCLDLVSFNGFRAAGRVYLLAEEGRAPSGEADETGVFFLGRQQA